MNFMNTGLLEKLFASKSRARVLRVLFEKGGMLYESEISLLAKITRSSAQKELGKLVNLRVVIVTRMAARTFYSLNKNFCYYGELKNIFSKPH